MRINSIQPQLFNQHFVRKISSKQSVPVQPNEQTSFKGGKGMVAGFLTGVFGTAAIAIATGGFGIPAVLATYGAIGAGVGTGYLGHKIEDKLTGEDEESSSVEWFE